METSSQYNKLTMLHISLHVSSSPSCFRRLMKTTATTMMTAMTTTAPTTPPTIAAVPSDPSTGVARKKQADL